MISPYVFPILKHALIDQKKYPYVKGYAKLKKQDIIDAIAEEFEIPTTFADVKTRRRDYSEPRKLLCKIMVFDMGMKKVDVAKEINGYDHSVVIYACTTFQNLYKVDEVYRAKCTRVLKKFHLTA